jgi:hypothetical protein
MLELQEWHYVQQVNGHNFWFDSLLKNLLQCKVNISNMQLIFLLLVLLQH